MPKDLCLSHTIDLKSAVKILRSKKIYGMSCNKQEEKNNHKNPEVWPHFINEKELDKGYEQANKNGVRLYFTCKAKIDVFKTLLL